MNDIATEVENFNKVIAMGGSTEKRDAQLRAREIWKDIEAEVQSAFHSGLLSFVKTIPELLLPQVADELKIYAGHFNVNLTIGANGATATFLATEAMWAAVKKNTESTVTRSTDGVYKDIDNLSSSIMAGTAARATWVGALRDIEAKVRILLQPTASNDFHEAYKAIDALGSGNAKLVYNWVVNCANERPGFDHIRQNLQTSERPKVLAFLFGNRTITLNAMFAHLEAFKLLDEASLPTFLRGFDRYTNVHSVDYEKVRNDAAYCRIWNPDKIYLIRKTREGVQ